jgi:hypothetical protein
MLSHITRERLPQKSLKHHKNMHGVTSLLFFIMITDIRENLVFILHTKQGHAY